jgi:DGQHR domain-containing protein
MNEYLKSTLRKEEIELAAAIGNSGGVIEQLVERLFNELPDLLLSKADVAELLHIPSSDELSSVLATLVTSGALEKSNSTQRPKDEEGIVLYRRSGVSVKRLKLLATENELSDGSSRFQFTCDGRLLRSIARIDRLDALSGDGQQREEIKDHVAKIAEGIKDGTQIPNSVLLVLREELTSVSENGGEEGIPESFIRIRPLQSWLEVPHPDSPHQAAQKSRIVELDFPFRAAAFDEEKAALLVDGQQRTAGLAFVDIDIVPSFYLSVNAVTADDEQAKNIFHVANSTVRISTQFSRALTASMGNAPGYLKDEQLVAQAVRSLSLQDQSSPFKDQVAYPGVKKKGFRPPVAFNSLFQVVTAFNQSGVKFDSAEQLASVVARAFTIVKATWPSAWGLRPEKSRLMHGLGLRALAALLAQKLEQRCSADDFDGDVLSDHTWASVEKSILRIKDHFVWTDAEAAVANKTAQKLFREETAKRQNTSQDIAWFTTHVKRVSLEQDTEAQKAKKKVGV